MKPLIATLVMLATIGVARGRAEACSPFTPRDHVVDAAHADDVVPPEPIQDPVLSVTRGEGGCEGTGWITINFSASDDRAPTDQLGFEVVAVSGADEHIRIPLGVRQYWWAIGEIMVYFTDWGQAIDLVVDITVVDLNGNRSAPVRVHVVADEVPEPEPASEVGGCSAGDPPGAGALLTGLAGLLGIARRRRARIGPPPASRS